MIDRHDVFNALQNRHKYVLIKKEKCKVVYTTWYQREGRDQKEQPSRDECRDAGMLPQGSKIGSKLSSEGAQNSAAEEVPSSEGKESKDLSRTMARASPAARSSQ